jgi:hypothetical protein
MNRMKYAAVTLGQACVPMGNRETAAYAETQKGPASFLKGAGQHF